MRNLLRLAILLSFCTVLAGAPSVLRADVPDSDGDGLLDHVDPCPFDPVHDPVGDPCNHDEDGDGFDDFVDLCPLEPGPDEGCPTISGTGCTN